MEKISEELLKKYIFGSIFLVSNKLQVIGDEFLGEITTKQWILLIGIIEFFKEEAPTLSEVGKVIGSSRQNVKQLSLKLEEKGFLKIEKDLDDSRAVRLYLTNKVKEYSHNRGDMDSKFLDTVFQGISEDELRIMFKAINKFHDNIENYKINY